MRHRRSSSRILAVLGVMAALAILTSCVADVPTEYPLVNNATCWTLVNTFTNEEQVCESDEVQWTDLGSSWVWRHCSSIGTTTNEYVYNSADCQTYKPTLLNKGHGDNYAHIYFGQDSTGYRAISIWCATPGGGVEVLSIREPDLALFGGENGYGTVTFYEGEPCAAPIEVFVLESGEYQINIGPDGEGKITATVFSGLPPTDLYYYNDDVDGTPFPPD